MPLFTHKINLNNISIFKDENQHGNVIKNIIGKSGANITRIKRRIRNGLNICIYNTKLGMNRRRGNNLNFSRAPPEVCDTMKLSSYSKKSLNDAVIMVLNEIQSSLNGYKSYGSYVHVKRVLARRLQKRKNTMIIYNNII